MSVRPGADRIQTGGRYIVGDRFVPLPATLDGSLEPTAEPPSDYQSHLEIIHRPHSFTVSKNKMAPMKNHLSSMHRQNNNPDANMFALMRDFVDRRVDYVGSMTDHLIVQSVTDRNDAVRDSLVRADPTFSLAELFTITFEPITRHWLQKNSHRTFWHGSRLELFAGVLGERSFRSSVGEQTRGGQSGVYTFTKEK